MEYYIECPDKDYDLALSEYKEIPLTQGKVALVDVEDYDWVSSIKWFYRKNGYAEMSCWEKGEVKGYLMHRFMMAACKNQHIDHINGNGLDNRRNNLRYCNHSQNHMNSKKYCNNTSGYKGVAYDKDISKYRAYIFICNKLRHLGCFHIIEEAALAYNEAAKKYFGEFARLNIIQKEAVN